MIEHVVHRHTYHPRLFTQLRGLALLVVLLFSSTTHAYVRTLSRDAKVPLTWRSSCLQMQLILGSAQTPALKELLQTAATRAATQWSSATFPCTDLTFAIAKAVKAEAFVEADQINTVQFRNVYWGRNARKPEDAVPYDRDTLAMTSTFANTKTGAIYDTDIEINGTWPLWGDLVENPSLLKSSAANDLQNTLTHEMGHVIGLDHSCDDGNLSNRLDHMNNPVPRCPGDAVAAESTMVAEVRSGDTARRTLAADDQNGLCALYPAGGDIECKQSGEGGCSMAKDSRTQRGWLVMAGVFLAVAFRRRR